MRFLSWFNLVGFLKMFRKISKSLTVRSNISTFINYFLVSKLVLGFYFDISKSKVYNRIIRFYCVIFSGLLICIRVKIDFTNRQIINSHVLLYHGQYIFGIIASHFHNQKYFFNLCSILKTISSSVGSKRHIKSNVAKFVVLLMLLVFSIYLILVFTYFNFEKRIITQSLCIISCYLEYAMVTLVFDL